MPKVKKIDSNVTGLAYAEEPEIGLLSEEQTPPGPNASVWVEMEPNSYADFGGEITTVARNPINASRQRKKGTVTDLDASGGLQSDLTQKNLQDLLQGFMFADFRRKGEAKNALGSTTLTFSMTAVGAVLTRVGGTLDLTTEFAVGDLVFVDGFSSPENNGLFAVGAVSATTLDLKVPDGSGTTATVVDEGATSDASVVQVGVQGTTGDIDVDASGSRPALTSTTLDFTTMGLTEGELIFIGGDLAAVQFANPENNGLARVRSIAANRLEFDKTDLTMVTETGTGLFIHLYTGRVLKNESNPDLIKRRTYNLERRLGVPDTDFPSQVQSEYLEGAVPNELSLQLNTADKALVDVAFIAIDNAQRDGATGLKPGTRVPIAEADAFNTSSDITKIKLAVHDELNPNPDPLFAFATELTLTINNNNSPNKALGTLGAFEVTTGQFIVEGNINSYFADTAAVEAVRNNEDITLHALLAKQNSGVAFDLPLITLGDGRLNVEQDQAITLPLSKEAATGAKIDTALNHTLLFVFFDYLPDAAE